MEDALELRCLFTDKVYGSADALFAAAKVFGFDFKAEVKQQGLDFYGCVKLVNYIRSESLSRKGADPSALVEAVRAGIKERKYASDTYLKPALEGDGLLCELGSFSDDDDDEDDAKGSTASVNDMSGAIERLTTENKALRAQLAQAQTVMNQMSATVRKVMLGSDEIRRPPEYDDDDFEDDEDEDGNAVSGAVRRPKGDKKTSTPTSSAPAARPQRPLGAPTQKDFDADYFFGYSRRDIHEEMLRDRVRTEAYRDAMYKNKDRFRGKIVLDIGCGTGILSMFAARAGAKAVIGIDASDMIDKARDIVKANGLSDRVTLIKSRVEDAKLPSGISKVDVIISEWMGYFLLFESMLPTVLFARERWLAEGGSVYPDKATMYVSGADCVAHRERNIDYWKDVYGFDMSCLVRETDRFADCTIEIVDKKSVVTSTAELAGFDIMKVKVAQLDFDRAFTLSAARDGALERFVVHFDTDFADKLKNLVKLDTGFKGPPTHWAQTVFNLAKPLLLKQGDVIRGKICARRGAKNTREYEVRITYWRDGEPESDRRMQDFTIRAY